MPQCQDKEQHRTGTGATHVKIMGQQTEAKIRSNIGEDQGGTVSNTQGNRGQDQGQQRTRTRGNRGQDLGQ